MSTRLKPSVGFLRPEATFTHIAARQHFGDDNAEYVPMETESICRAVQHGEIDFGVLPIENLFEGSVGATLDAMYATADINVVAEVFLPIHHHLLSTGPIEAVTRVYSHEQALNQCRNNLRRLSEELDHDDLVVAREPSSNHLVIDDRAAAHRIGPRLDECDPAHPGRIALALRRVRVEPVREDDRDHQAGERRLQGALGHGPRAVGRHRGG